MASAYSLFGAPRRRLVLRRRAAGGEPAAASDDRRQRSATRTHANHWLDRPRTGAIVRRRRSISRPEPARPTPRTTPPATREARESRSSALHGERLDKALVALAPRVLAQPPAGADRGRAGAASTASRRQVASRKVRAGQRVAIDAACRPPRAGPSGAEADAARGRVRGRRTCSCSTSRPAWSCIRRPGNWSGTLLNGLLAHHPARAALPRAGIVHRLDKDTSGLMVVGKTLAAMTALVRAIAAREVHRQYLAIAHGKAPAARVQRRGADRPRSADRACAWRSSPAGKPARTDVERIAGARRLQRPALHPAHRAHAPDPRAPGVARPSAGRRRALRRRAGARASSARRCMRAGSRSRIRVIGTAARLRRAACRPTWRRHGGSSPVRRLERRGRRHRVTIAAIRFDAIAPARRDPAAARASRRDPSRPDRDPRAHSTTGQRSRTGPAAFQTLTDMPPGDAAEDYDEDHEHPGCQARPRDRAHLRAASRCRCARCARCSTTRSAPTRCATLLDELAARLGRPRRRTGRAGERLALPEPARDARVPRPAQPGEAAASTRARCWRRWRSSPTASR